VYDACAMKAAALTWRLAGSSGESLPNRGVQWLACRCSRKLAGLLVKRGDHVRGQTLDFRTFVDKQCLERAKAMYSFWEGLKRRALFRYSTSAILHASESVKSTPGQFHERS
jgi:hypothetical protein